MRKKPFTGVTPDGAHNNMNPLFDHQFAVMAIDRQTGAVVWRRTVATRQPHESTHESATWASNSPVTDGEHVLSFFGSNGLYCLDTGGRLLWSRDLGDMQVKHGHGEGASPLLHGETVVVNWDHEGASVIVALAKRTGEELWRQPRDEVTSWATPIVVTHDGQAQVVVSGTRRVRGYDLKTGAVIWEAGGLPGNIVASPVGADGMVFAAGSYEKQTLLAIRLTGAKGELTGTQQIAWQKKPEHAVRAVAVVVRRLALLSPTLSGRAVPRECEDGRRAKRAVSARVGFQYLLIAGGCSGSNLRDGSKRKNFGHEQ